MNFSAQSQIVLCENCFMCYVYKCILKKFSKCWFIAKLRELMRIYPTLCRHLCLQ